MILLIQIMMQFCEQPCQRLIKGGMLPGRTRQPAHVNLHMTLSQLRNAPGASEVEAAWAAARASQPGWLTGAEADAAACDARLAPVPLVEDPATP